MQRLHHSKSARKLAFTSTLLAVLSGCSSEQPITLSARAPGVAAGTIACVDVDADLTCDDTEPAGTLDAQGNVSITVSAGVGLDGKHVLIPLPPESDWGKPSHLARVQPPPASFTLMAPARRNVVVGALSTLVSLRLHTSPSLKPDDAERAVAADFNLADTLSAQTQEEWPDGPAFQRSEALLSQVLRQAHAQAMQEQPSSGLSALQKAAERTIPVFQRYAHVQGDGLLPTVSARTLVGEALAQAAPPACAMHPVATIAIETQDGAEVTSKEDYLDATLTVTPAGGSAQTLSTRIRGRGNTTWAMPKKPYRLKLDKKAELLGMTADKDWALLANYTDKTLLRNAVAFCMGRMLEMRYTPDSRFVELTLNGEYQGLYQLTEHVKVAEHRVDIGEEATHDGDTEAGFLLEWDDRLDDDFWFVSERESPIVIKSDATAGMVPTIASVFNAMEGALFGEQYQDPDEGYARHLDVESVVDYYLVQEFLRNNDAFFSSTYITRYRGERMHFGPLWDFDIAAGNINYNQNDDPAGWWVKETSSYMARLFTDPVFLAHVQARWTYLSSLLRPALMQHIEASAVSLDEAQQRNFERWPILDTVVWPNPHALGSYSAEVDYLKDWLTSRGDWLDGQLPLLTAEPADAAED